MDFEEFVVIIMDSNHGNNGFGAMGNNYGFVDGSKPIITHDCGNKHPLRLDFGVTCQGLLHRAGIPDKLAHVVGARLCMLAKQNQH